ncbi:MAG: rRNA pseudouridine synthase [Herbinix sp.]|nr:rRNA pseudouridine synthase [Herbinix sp.]
MRLDRFLAEAGIGTKKIVRIIVKEGKVTVNHQTIINPALEIDEKTDIIAYLDNVVVHTGNFYYMFHKPAGCVTARKDSTDLTVMDYFDRKDRSGLFPVGRLDKDTEGLLLMTNDGEFSHRLMFPDKQIDKTYFFWAFGSLDQNAIEQLKSGVSMGDEEAFAKATHIQVEEEGLYLKLKDRMNYIGSKEIRNNPSGQTVVSGYITITEGRKHQVKRMLKAVGCYVAYLKRVSIGGLSLDEALQKGQYRALTEDEIRRLCK